MGRDTKADTCISAGAWSKGYPKHEGVEQMLAPYQILPMREDTVIKVPYSEMAVHSGISGGKISRLGISKNGRVGCVVVEMPDGSCKSACGLTNEVIPVTWADRFKKHFMRGK